MIPLRVEKLQLPSVVDGQRRLPAELIDELTRGMLSVLRSLFHEVEAMQDPIDEWGLQRLEFVIKIDGVWQLFDCLAVRVAADFTAGRDVTIHWRGPA